MTKDEYLTALQEIVLDGLGFDAIRDLAEMLANYDAYMLSAMKEMKAERKAIRKICEGIAPNKEKVKTVWRLCNEESYVISANERQNG